MERGAGVTVRPGVPGLPRRVHRAGEPVRCRADQCGAVPGSDPAIDWVVPLRDVSEYHVWIERESPSLSARSVTRTFIAELGDQPWRAPSVPIAELSSQPQYEVRTAALEVEGEQDVRIWWAHVYATGDVDLIAITNR